MIKSTFTNAFDVDDFCTNISSAVDVELKAEEQRLFINATLTAASKTVTLGLDDGQTAIVTNAGGTNAFTLKNVEGDTGTSLAAGKVALVIASTTADATVVKVLN